MVEDLVATEEAQDLAEEEAQDLAEDHEKCTKQLVETVARNAKFHLSQNKTSQSIAASVFKAIKETKIILV